MRVCQFRHDGKWTSAAADRMPLHQEDLHSYFTGMKASVKPLSWSRFQIVRPGSDALWLSRIDPESPNIPGWSEPEKFQSRQRHPSAVPTPSAPRDSALP
jgi:hypothetical protein